ncbi:MAG: biotin/lipoate A/B protein ligase family protein [Phycisphaerae bacterium]
MTPTERPADARAADAHTPADAASAGSPHRTPPAPGRVLHVFRDPPLDGPTNMARDEALLHSEEVRPAALRLYEWSPPTLSLGYFQRHELLAALPPELRSLAVVRRTTGGGAILHDREITYCLVLDESVPIARRSPAELYRVAHQCWRDVLALDGIASTLAPDDFPLPTPRAGPFFCFQKPGRTDLLLGGAKLLGSAQRRVAGRVLQHGSLILDQRFAAHPGAALGGPAVDAQERWIKTFIAALGAALDVAPRPARWSETLFADATQRRAKYAGDDWTRKF